ncbi:hypothetical protein ACS0TY_002567 [Phlomoides rotata]
MAANADEVLHDLGIVKVYKDGRIERLIGQDVVPPSVDPSTAVQSKDVQISPEINLSARIFLPGNANRSKKLPLVVYFHGGGFIIESAFSPTYHKHLNYLVAEANVIAVSVNYRLAPENPLPTAYEDSWLVLNWVVSQSTEEDWINDYADLNRVFLGGDSAGGNIAHHMAARVGSENSDGINLKGVFLNCPFFSGEDPIGDEETHKIFPISFTDKLWRFACPGTTGLDDPWMNPARDPKLSSLGCKRLLVYVAGNDVLRGRGWYYKEALLRSGWDGDIEVIEIEGENHVFSVTSPDGEQSRAMLKKVATFINH